MKTPVRKVKDIVKIGTGYNAGLVMILECDHTYVFRGNERPKEKRCMKCKQGVKPEPWKPYR